MKVFITGASGLLGRQIVLRALARGHQVIAQYNQNKPIFSEVDGLRLLQMDLSEFEALDRLLLEEFPDVIINAAAISNPAGVDQDPRLAEQINVELPKRLAQLSFHTSARFYHYSTDMVFDGLSEEAYFITDQPRPSNLYAEQKLAAEKEVLRAAAELSCVIRIPILLGDSQGGARSVHEKIFSCLSKSEEVKLFTDEIRQPTTAENVAYLTIELAERDKLTGIFHWAGADSLSRYEMGKRILEHFGLPESLLSAVSKTDDPAFANRPSSLRLDCATLVSKVRAPQIKFSEQLEELTMPRALQAWYREERLKKA